MKIESYKVRGQTKYRFRAYVGTDPATGKPVRVQQSGFDTRKEAQLACAEIVAKAAPSKARDVTYRQMYDLWMETYKLKVKPSTLRNTELIFNYHILPFFGSMKIKEITPLQCQQWTTEQEKSCVVSGKRYAYMSKIFDFAMRQEVIERNPAALVERAGKKGTPHSQKSEMNFYTKEELKVFLKLCEKRLPHKWYVFFRMLSYTGMRRGEALALTWDDVDAKKSTLSITKTITRGSTGAYVSTTPKTDKSTRVIPIDDQTLQLILSLPHEGKYIFSNSKGSFTSQSVPVKMMHKAVDGSALRYISPHGLRHTHCSILFSAGVSIPEVQDRLGHSDVKTTIDVYNHVYQSDKQEALDRFTRFMDNA